MNPQTVRLSLTRSVEAEVIINPYGVDDGKVMSQDGNGSTI
jgi:hypothetical protein